MMFEITPIYLLKLFERVGHLQAEHPLFSGGPAREAQGWSVSGLQKAENSGGDVNMLPS